MCIYVYIYIYYGVYIYVYIHGSQSDGNPSKAYMLQHEVKPVGVSFTTRTIMFAGSPYEVVYGTFMESGCSLYNRNLVVVVDRMLAV